MSLDFASWADQLFRRSENRGQSRVSKPLALVSWVGHFFRVLACGRAGLRRLLEIGRSLIGR